MGETGSGGQGSENLYYSFLLMHGAVLPPCLVVWSEAAQSWSLVSMVGLMLTSSKKTCAFMTQLLGLLLPVTLSPVQATADSWLCRRSSDTQRQVWLSCWNHHSFPVVLVLTRFVCALQVFLACMVFDFDILAPLLPSPCSFSFVLGCGVSQHTSFDGY